METETAYVFLIVYMFYMLHVAHDLRSKLTALLAQLTEDRELHIANFLDSFGAGDLNRAAECYQKLAGSSPENAKAFVESLRKKSEVEVFKPEPSQS
jgi:hypothetical protein